MRWEDERGSSEAAAALGYAPIKKIEKLYAAFAEVNTVTVD